MPPSDRYFWLLPPYCAVFYLSESSLPFSRESTRCREIRTFRNLLNITRILIIFARIFRRGNEVEVSFLDFIYFNLLASLKIKIFIMLVCKLFSLLRNVIKRFPSDKLWRVHFHVLRILFWAKKDFPFVWDHCANYTARSIANMNKRTWTLSANMEKLVNNTMLASLPKWLI